MLNTKLQFLHRSRFIKQFIYRPEIAVIGGYHLSNLGDMALGYSVLEQLKYLSINADLQTIYNIEKWINCPYAILGGGAIGYTDSLKNVYNRYYSNFQNIGILGVDFNEKSYEKSLLDMLKSCGWLSCRSESQALKLKKLTDRKVINHHPDIAFALCSKDYKLKRQVISEKNKKLLLNLVPLYGTLDRDGSIHPDSKYEIERPELYKNFQQMQVSYKEAVHELVKNALSEGYLIETAPFTPADENFSRFILNGLPIIHKKYSPNPYKILKRMAKADWVLATRYHATIFAMKAGAKLTALAYAHKNERLLEELHIPRESYLTTDDLAEGINSFKSSFRIDNNLVSELEEKSKSAILSCISAVYKN